MNLSKNNLNNDQPKTLSKRDDKKSVNLKWNSRLFFQLSLIISLLIVYSVMQTKFENKEKAFVTHNNGFLEEPPIFIYTLEKIKKVQKQKVVKKQLIMKAKIINNIIKADDFDTIETDTQEYNKENDIPIPPVVMNKETEVKTINYLGVEHVPVFPGCEALTSNVEKSNCMSLKIKEFILKKFKADRFDYLNLIGEQKITVQFYINENGNVSEITARSNEKALEKEAIRVVSKLPKMKPGRQGDNVVKVQYLLPIVFKVN